MILPDNKRCMDIIEALLKEPNLSDWERSFVDSNDGRQTFSGRQREVIGELAEKFDV